MGVILQPWWSNVVVDPGAIIVFDEKEKRHVQFSGGYYQEIAHLGRRHDVCGKELRDGRSINLQFTGFFSGLLSRF